MKSSSFSTVATDRTSCATSLYGDSAEKEPPFKIVKALTHMNLESTSSEAYFSAPH